MRRVFYAAVVGGCLGAGAVVAGALLEFPCFSIRSGFWGTSSLDSGLYGLGNNTIAVVIVAALWFVYGAVGSATLWGCVELLMPDPRREASSPNGDSKK